jgi:hypothetical protein
MTKYNRKVFMEDKIIILKSYETAVKAAVDKDVLTKNEISSYLDDDLTNPFVFSTFDGGGHKLYVFERDSKNAHKILEEFHAEAN